jgi:Flp pilus assembly protein TadD
VLEVVRASYMDGVELMKHGRWQDALCAFQIVATSDEMPQTVKADAWNSCGLMYARLGRTDLEHVSYRIAVSLNPKCPEALNNMGAAFCGTHDGESAAAFFDYALSLRPDMENTRAGLVGALVQTGRYRRAVQEAERVVRADPDNVAAHWNLALALLASGDFQRGLAEHEWRRKLTQFVLERPRITSPEWTGSQPLHGKRVLVVAEQGFGDMIMWARYLPHLVALGADVIFECHEPLMPLFSWMPGLHSVTRYGAPMPPHDYHVFVGSLARIIQLTTGNIVGRPYLTVPRRELSGLDRYPKVGIAWKGRHTHPNDRNRSLSSETAQHLLRYEKAHWVSLQFDVAPPLSSVVDCRDIIGENVAETAGIIRGLDLVVTVDSAIAHLAGALGVPCWVMLPNPPEWRWHAHKPEGANLTGRTPWYDSVELIPQPRPGYWKPVIEEVHRRLDAVNQGIAWA